MKKLRAYLSYYSEYYENVLSIIKLISILIVLPFIISLIFDKIFNLTEIVYNCIVTNNEFKLPFTNISLIEKILINYGIGLLVILVVLIIYTIILIIIKIIDSYKNFPYDEYIKFKNKYNQNYIKKHKTYKP